MEQKKSWGSSTYIWQNRLQNKGHKRDQEGLHNTKGSIQQENITIVNIYAANIGTPEYIKKILVDFKE